MRSKTTSWSVTNSPKSGPLTILRFKRSIAVRASSSESWPTITSEPSPEAGTVLGFWMSRLSHLDASHLRDGLKGGPRVCW